MIQPDCASGQASCTLFTLHRLPVELGRVQEGILVGALIGNVQWAAQESACGHVCPPYPNLECCI
jgi:hypothetical protein